MAFVSSTVTGTLLGAVVGTVAGLGLLWVLAATPAAPNAVWQVPATRVQTMPTAAVAVGFQPPARPATRAGGAAPQPLAVHSVAADGVVVAEGAGWRHVWTVVPVFFAALAAVNVVALKFLRPKPIAMAAMSGDVETPFSRREALIAASVGLSAAAPALAAQKQKQDAEQQYRADTQLVLEQMRSVLALAKSDESMAEQVEALRENMSSWVSIYRRDDRFEGRASFGATYSAINALAGHYTSVGSTIPLPAKRATQVLKNIDNATQLVGKGR